MAEPYVSARNLGKSFNGTKVLEGVSFEVGPGEIIGLLGKNGAGKTTLLELVLGFTPVSEGRVEVFGHESHRLPGSVKKRVGFVPQQDELVNQLTAEDQVRLIRSFYTGWDDALIARLIGKWGLDPGERIKGMSVGQRQKLSILLSLGHRPDLLILDEPVASLDPLARRHFLEELIEVSADDTRSVLFSSHIVSDIERLANKIWILKDHRLYWHGDFDDLKESVVRLHMQSRAPLPSTLAIPNAISVEVAQTNATAIVHDWTDSLHQEISALTGARVEIERLTLEDIFLEMHR